MGATKFCPNCGQPVNEGERFCRNCGAQIQKNETSSGTENRGPAEGYTATNDTAFNNQSASYESAGYQNAAGDRQQYAEPQPEESGNGGNNQPKRSRRWIIIVIILVLVILGAVMAYFLFFRSTPEQVVNDYLSNAENILQENLDVQGSEYGELFQTFMNKGDAVQYEIQDTSEEGDTATVKVDFTFHDHTDAMTYAFTEVFTTSIFSSILGQGSIDEDEMTSLLIDAANKALANEEVVVNTKTVSFPCTRTSGQWEIDFTDDLKSDLTNVYTGNAFKTIMSLKNSEETPDTSEENENDTDNETEHEEKESQEQQEQQEQDIQEEEPSVQNGEVEFSIEPEFDPDPNYDKYTVVEYNLAGADTVVTVCSNNAETDFEILCNFFGDDQEWRGTWDGSNVKTEYDRTLFMTDDAPGIIQKAIDANNWKSIE